MAREGRRPRRDRAASGLAQPAFARLRNPFAPFEIVSADQIEAIHVASLRVLAEIGMNFLLPEARAILAAAGCEVEPAGPRVRFDPAFVEERIKTAPATFTLHARNPERDVTIGLFATQIAWGLGLWALGAAGWWSAARALSVQGG